MYKLSKFKNCKSTFIASRINS